jgi:ABC-type multidrug transport system ATPase subunit
LDAAAAENIMQEIVRVAKDERIIILCTIHQPSTKVYNGFDQVMILSKGREAFTGNVTDATPYFEQIGYPLPVQTNPAGKGARSKEGCQAWAYPPLGRLTEIFVFRSIRQSTSWIWSMQTSLMMQKLTRFSIHGKK